MRDHAMVIKADAKAMGAITAHTPRGAERWLASKPASRTFGGTPFTGTSECISHMPDGTSRIFAPTRQSVHKKQRTHALTVGQERQLAARERLQATLDAHAIGNVE